MCRVREGELHDPPTAEVRQVSGDEMSLCVVCHERKADVPDRERMGRPIKRVCLKCHHARLVGDVERILRGLVADSTQG